MRELVPVAIALVGGLVLGVLGVHSGAALAVVGVLVVALLVFGPEGRIGRTAPRITQRGR